MSPQELQTIPSGLPIAAETGAAANRGAGEVASLRCVASTSFDAPILDPAIWDKAVASLGGSVYLTWAWLRTWWRFYGKGNELRLMVCSAGPEIVALLPMYIQAIGYGPFQLRVARLVGANLPPKVFDPPVATGWAPAVVDAMVSRLLEEDRCDVISFGPVSDTCEGWQSFPKSFAHHRCAPVVECDRSEVHTLFVLPESQNEYLGSLSKNEQKQRRKYELRMLKKEHQVTVDVISGSTEALLAEFDAFAVLHAEQWKAQGKAGHFGSWPAGLAYNRALVETLGPLDRVRFVRIRADGETISNQYIFAFADRWYWELPARSIAPQWDRYSLGPSGIVTMIGEAIGAGVHWIQGGVGHYDYKLRLEAQEHIAPRYRIYRSDAVSRLRLRLFRRFQWALRICYHKIWYRRIMPRIPARFRRPQWRLWLQWDF